MNLPRGYHPVGFENIPNLVCKLIKSLYGLKQASREWFTKLASCLLAGYKQSVLDHSLFTYTSGDSFMAVVVYVDDILLSRNDFLLIQSLKSLLHHKFSIKDLGPVKFYMGLEFHMNQDGLFLSHHKFIIDLLKSADMELCKPLSATLDPHIKLYDNDM